jgi:type I restriction enzyme, R subunit
VNQAIRTQEPGADQAEGLTFDLSQIDLERLRAEFAKKVRRKATVLKDIRELVEQKLAEMLKRNPQRMDYYKRYQEIIADYNREKDRVTIEETFAKLTELLDGLDEEQRRAAEEGLSEDELALFDLLRKDNLGKAERETVKQASRALLASLRRLLAPLERWTEKEQTQAEVETTILDQLYRDLPSPPFTEEDKQAAAAVVYRHVRQQSVSGAFSMAA